ncbi:MAG: hypothetical protein LH679_02825 [Cyanobacteria bacterium CAN_BIN43]|nr:hypothetical protein [Cyanobacteria bacterium CAN_BIN43]
MKKRSCPQLGSGIEPQILLKLCPEYCKNTVLKNPKNPVDFDYLKRVILEKRIRNSQLGIFQLSMEIFELREKLVDMVRSSVNEESIEIECENVCSSF